MYETAGGAVFELDRSVLLAVWSAETWGAQKHSGDLYKRKDSQVS